MEYFTSDHHFCHKNILKFENRPYQDIEEMNEGLIESWNKVVSEKDIVHHVGDFSMGNQAKSIEIAKRLNGKIIIYKGNHDESNKLKRMLKEGAIEEYHMVGDYIKRDGFQLWLTHYPLEIGFRPKKYSIHGHIHSNYSSFLNQVNVGVDSPLFYGKEQRKGEELSFGEPVSLDLLLEKIKFFDTYVRHEWEKSFK